MRIRSKPGQDSALDEIRLAAISSALDVNTRNMQSLVEHDGPAFAHFDQYQATTLLCIVNGLANVSKEVKEMADLLRASEERPHSG